MNVPGPALVRVTATRWLIDEPFPGVVEVVLRDASGRLCTFIDKAPMFDTDVVLTRDAVYPIDLDVACTVLGHRVRDGQMVAEISTAAPWGLETVDGTHVFEVPADQVH